MPSTNELVHSLLDTYKLLLRLRDYEEKNDFPDNELLKNEIQNMRSELEFNGYNTEQVRY